MQCKVGNLPRVASTVENWKTRHNHICITNSFHLRREKVSPVIFVWFAVIYWGEFLMSVVLPCTHRKRKWSRRITCTAYSETLQPWKRNKTHFFQTFFTTRRKHSQMLLLTCNGVIWAENFVKPTMSLKKIETSSNDSAGTGLPCFKSLATDLKNNI